MRWNRANNQFEEWSGSAWSPKVLGIAGGGTGSNTVAGARGALGLGTMSVQNANAIAVTGGTLAGVTLTGAIPFSGGPVTITQTAAGVGLTVQGFAGSWTSLIQGGGAASYGLLTRAGTGNASEMALQVQNQAGTTTGLTVNGAMTVTCPTRLVIPVGANFWA